MLVFLLLVATNVALGFDGKIIGGHECKAHSVPWQVSLRYNGWHYCGGALISENWVLTGAHCLKYKETIEVRLGEHHLGKKDGPEQFIKSAAQIRHPKFDRFKINNDIMLVKLAEPAQINEFVQPIALPTSCAADGSACQMSGWGPTESNTTVGAFENLNCMDVPTWSHKDCKNSYPNRITDAMLCAGLPEGGKDFCQTDAGGPLVCNGELQGVASWWWGCDEEKLPGVYAKVCQFTDWISSTMAAN